MKVFTLLTGGYVHLGTYGNVTDARLWKKKWDSIYSDVRIVECKLMKPNTPEAYLAIVREVL